MSATNVRMIGTAAAALGLACGLMSGCSGSGRDKNGTGTNGTGTTGTAGSDGRLTPAETSPQPVATDGARPALPEPAPAPSQAQADAPPREFDPKTTDADEINGWRPQWWIEDPMKNSEAAIACGLADNAELAKARATAVEVARYRMAQMLGRDPRKVEMKTDALRLPAGQYRAFVLIKAPLK
jgi:hypothetical protein